MEIPKNENNNFEKSTEKALPSLEEFINERQDGKKIDFHEGQYIEPPGVIQKVANGIVIGTEAIIDTTKDKIHHLVDAIGNVTHSAIETAENMKENISDTVHFVGEKIIFTKDKMEESVKETTQSASEKIDKISNSIQETTKEAANGIKEKVYKVGDFTQEELSKVNQIFEEGEKKYQQMEEKSGQAIKEKILETSESLAEKLAVIPPVLPTSEKESELHQKRKIEAKEVNLLIFFLFYKSSLKNLFFQLRRKLRRPLFLNPLLPLKVHILERLKNLLLFLFPKLNYQKFKYQLFQLRQLINLWLLR